MDKKELQSILQNLYEADTFNIDANLIEGVITKKTRAIMPVSLFGQPADMDNIQTIANKYNLKVIIDGAQSFGSTYKNKTDSNLGDISITSFFPSKPLGCYGDGGAVFTDDDELAEILKSIRIHGKGKDKYENVRVGLNSRLDTIQAAILIEKLELFPEELKKRSLVAEEYHKILNEKIKIKKYETPNFKIYAKESQFKEVLGNKYNDGNYYKKCNNIVNISFYLLK